MGQFLVIGVIRMIETEAKIRIEKGKLKKVLYILGEPRFFLQKNIVYKFFNGFIRIRFEKGRNIITFKGKRREGKLNSRREVEFTFGWKGILKKLVKLGNPVVYNKKRANFSFCGCVVSIDYFREDNIFIEIEGNEKDIFECIDRLGLEKEKIEQRSYFELFEK